MKCKPLSWLLWGLLPILALIGYTLFSEKDNIEADLTGRMQAKLNDAGVGWAKPSFDGRDGTLQGLTLEEKERVTAATKASGLYGVRILDDKTGLAPAVTPYLWSATTQDKTLLLSGYVPTQAAQSDILAKAKTLYPDYAITDNTKIARGTSTENWTDQTRFSLTQLKKLHSGTTSLSDDAFSIQGRATTSANYTLAKENVRTKLTSGLTLHKDQILPPIASPYKWSLAHIGKVVTLTGFVPNEATRKALHARIKEHYPDATITDETQIADGAPDKWLESATLSSKHASTLIDGHANLTDQSANISGSVPDYPTHKEATNAFEAATLDGFTHTSTLTSLKAAIPTASPYTWNLAHKNNTVTLDGYVPDEATRTALHAKIQSHYPNATITDNTTIAHGAPTDWLNAAIISSEHASKLIDGKATLNDTNANISGSVSDYATLDKETMAYKTAPLDGFTQTSSLTSLTARIPTASPYTWNLAHKDNEVTLEGYVPNESARKKLLARIHKHYPNATITDKTTIAKGAPKGWLKAATISSKHASKLIDGKASLHNTDANISGSVPNYAVHDKATAAYKTASVDGFSHTSSLTSLKARIPTASPFTWMADNTTDTLILRGYAPNETAKAKVLATAKARFPNKKIQDDMVIAKGAPKGWVSATRQSLNQLSRLDYGTASLNNKDANLTGFAKNEALKAKIKPVAERLGFASTLNITAPKPKPKPVPVKPAPVPTPVVEAAIPKENITGKDSAKICENLIGSFLQREKINFKVAKATITKSSFGLLNKLANIIRKCPDTKILINGHTDSDGSAAGNKRLSFNRATAVYAYLVDQGIKTNRLKAAGLGESTPLVPNNSPENKAKNRRIEFKLSTN